MEIIYVYENEEFAQNTFNDIIGGSRRENYDKVVWGISHKEISNKTIKYRFIHYKALETCRGKRVDNIFFEPSLVGKLTIEQMTIATFMLFSSVHRYGYMTLDGIYEANRKDMMNE